MLTSIIIIIIINGARNINPYPTLHFMLLPP